MSPGIGFDEAFARWQSATGAERDLWKERLFSIALAERQIFQEQLRDALKELTKSRHVEQPHEATHRLCPYSDDYWCDHALPGAAAGQVPGAAEWEVAPDQLHAATGSQWASRSDC